MPEQMQKKDLALVGAGYWGKNLARNFNELGSLHTICDSNPQTLASYGDDYASLNKTGEFDDVLRNPEIRKVAIAAPATQHFSLAKASLEAGKDVLVEKPLCLSVSEGEELVALAKELGRILMVGHLLNYHPCVVELKRLIAEGKLGKLLYITSNRLNLGKIRTEENALWSFAPHDLSVILAIAGGQLPKTVSCTGSAHLTKGVPDTTLTQLQFGSELRAHVYVSWLNPFKEQKLTVVGSHGMAVFDDTKPVEEKLALYYDYISWDEGRVPTPNKDNFEFAQVEPLEPLKQECIHFVESCEMRTQPITDGDEGLRVLKVLDSAQGGMEGDGLSRTLGADNDSRGYYSHPTATIDEGASIGKGSKIWHYTHVSKGSSIGGNCSLSQNCFVAPDVAIGSNVKVQNNVSIYKGVEIEDDVFLGPSCVLTNVINPRSEVNRKSEFQKTIIKKGATIGANATIVCGNTIGKYAFIAAGAVITKDVPDYALMVGVPARQQGWVSRSGEVLEEKPAS